MRGGRGKPNRPPSEGAERNNKPKVLLVLRENSSDLEYMLRTEVGVMVAMLEAAGLAVVSASESGRTERGSSAGVSFPASLLGRSIMLCGAAGGSV